jgi:hypothetical protein
MLRRHSLLSGAAAVVLAAAGCASSPPDNEHGPTFGPEGGNDATQGDTGSPDEGASETGGGSEGGTEAGPGLDAGMDGAGEAAENEAGGDAGTESGSDAPVETGGDGGFVAPTCDGVIGAGEYGGVADEQASSNGQVWYMTWDATNLYVAISSANVAEGDVIYVAIAPGSDAGAGLTAGQPYDGTDITTMPFAASLVVYAHQNYIEARTPSGGAWGMPNTMAPLQVCVNTTTNAREEVIPWSLIGGRPASFGWFGYFAAAGHSTGFIYGQMPIDDPGGGPANAETYTKYYAVPDATPGVDTPFADEQ